MKNTFLLSALFLITSLFYGQETATKTKSSRSKKTVENTLNNTEKEVAKESKRAKKSADDAMMDATKESKRAKKSADDAMMDATKESKRAKKSADDAMMDATKESKRAKKNADDAMIEAKKEAKKVQKNADNQINTTVKSNTVNANRVTGREQESNEKAPRVPDKVTGEYKGKPLYTGPRGGTYYINKNGNKTYVQQ